MNYEDISKRTAQIYDFIYSQSQLNDYSPSVREIGAGVGLSSTASVQTHINKLIEKGLLAREDGKSRSFSFPKETNETGRSKDRTDIVDVPLIGHVAAGVPILAEENLEDTIPFPAHFVSGVSFMLRVKGESMINAGICDGDFVVVKQQSVAENSDIVVALIDGEATVKTYYREADYIRLQPENDSFEPILSRDVEIAGKVVALLRRMG